MMEPAAGKSLEKWHQMAAAGDFSSLPDIVHPEAVFRSPAVYKPYQGAMALCFIINTVAGVFEDFEYVGEYHADSGRDVVLEFRAKVGDRELKGADYIHFDEEGRIREFEVMIRPLSGLTALAEEMNRRVGNTLLGSKKG